MTTTAKPRKPGTLIVHADLYTYPGTPGTYKAPQTLCAPQEDQQTAAGWQRLYLATGDPALVTCPKCRKAAA